ncbi:MULTISPECIES: hypothetical protein [Streptomyces]|uniref:hypothetical protein n=1 Tax=Streptomyces TaxID=1883 RepID=UPI000F79D02B|nr:hypothetical protein [Streptomyces sp. WAC05858]RSS39075.1 hypothetical protein EF902_28605 [Streptomyces sp. WAC05858]WTB03027.1 hypothetical protein OG546_01495 [Streptomyces antimycoticus]
MSALFDAAADYEEYADGRPRVDGVRAFPDLALPEGSDDQPPELETAHNLGNRRNVQPPEQIHTQGVEAYTGSSVR